MINGIKNWEKVKERKYGDEGQGDYACQGASGVGFPTWRGPLGGDNDSKMVGGTNRGTVPLGKKLGKAAEPVRLWLLVSPDSPDHKASAK